jgi:hypothetical protein
MPPVIALAGRRVDAARQSEQRFPLDNVDLVRSQLKALLERRRPTALVCSAACGADLSALEAAGSCGTRRRVVLPFNPAEFRLTSVTDRPGNWGEVYDRVIAEVEAVGDLVVLDCARDDKSAYERTNQRILDEALGLAGFARKPDAAGPVPPEIAVAVIVWEGRPRGGNDLTEQFAASARLRGLAVEEILVRS